MKYFKNMDSKKILSLIIGTIIVIYIIFFSGFLQEAITGYNDAKGNEENTSVSGDLKIYFIDVGQGDSILIKTGDDTMLIDAGNNADGEKLVNYFKGMGITKFNYVIGTHAHEDHIGGMDEIINNFDINKFYMPNAITTTTTFEDVLDALNAKEIKFETPNIDDEFDLGDAKVKVLYTGTDTSDLNASSIVLKITYGENKFLLMGDAPTSVEERILDNDEDVTADVLKVGHHGSSYSTSDDFLSEVNPSYGVISVGLNNSYGHPSSTTLDKLLNKDITVYRTDEKGTIIMTSNGTTISVDTVKTDTNG